MNKECLQQISNWWYRELNFCGCGRPNDVLIYIAEYLRALSTTYDGREDPDWAERHDILDALLLSPKSEGAKHRSVYDYAPQLFLAYWLDSKGYTEHGGGVGGAWVTDEGRDLLGLLDGITEDDELPNPNYD